MCGVYPTLTLFFHNRNHIVADRQKKRQALRAQPVDKIIEVMRELTFSGSTGQMQDIPKA